jgi:hypothetical protein
MLLEGHLPRVIYHQVYDVYEEKDLFGAGAGNDLFRQQSWDSLPHSGLRKDFRHRKSVTLSIGTPLCPYPIAYRRAYGISFRWTVFKKPSKPAVWLNDCGTRESFLQSTCKGSLKDVKQLNCSFPTLISDHTRLCLCYMPKIAYPPVSQALEPGNVLFSQNFLRCGTRESSLKSTGVGARRS